MNIASALQSQYLAALEMLGQAVVHCPDWLWNEQEDKNRFWHVAYHSLFYTHLYLQPTGDDFVPWERARKDYNFMGAPPWSPQKPVDTSQAYTKDEILEYLKLCQQQVRETMESLDLAADSGFDWIPMDKFEHLLYTLRHIQLHTGELCERLWTRAQIEVAWVGTQDVGEKP